MSNYRLQLPRYQLSRRQQFDDRINEVLVPEIRVLDMGSGRSPAIQPSLRPQVCVYVGLDVSADELNRAAAGSYDEKWVRDITSHAADLEQSFDLIVSWQVLEHVKPLEAAIANMRSYLRPGGRLIAQLSGTFSLFGIINRIIPPSVGVWAMHRLLQRDPETVFPAYYDQCWYAAIQRSFADRQDCLIVPQFYGADYFRFLGPAERCYLRYENWAVRKSVRNLATHYLIVATK